MFRTAIFSQPGLVFALAVCVGCCLLALLVRRAHRAATDSKASVRKMEKRMAAAEKDLGAVMQIVSDQSRRLALLESRARTAKPQAASSAQAEPAERNSSGMSEKRHQVLAMTRRGMDAETIAERLSMPNGEVELIISLNVAA
jgi:hypothetical protein